MAYKFIHALPDGYETLTEMSDDYYNELKADLIKAKNWNAEKGQIDVLVQFVPAEIKNIVRPEDT